MKLGQKIRRARKAKGYSQARLAELMHICRATLSRIENDRKDVTEDFLQQLHTILDGRFRPACPEGGGGIFYSPVPNRFAHSRVEEDDYPCRHCSYSSVNFAFDVEESPCGRCHYNRRRTNR